MSKVLRLIFGVPIGKVRRVIYRILLAVFLLLEFLVFAGSVMNYQSSPQRFLYGTAVTPAVAVRAVAMGGAGVVRAAIAFAVLFLYFAAALFVNRLSGKGALDKAVAGSFVRKRTVIGAAVLVAAAVAVGAAVHFIGLARRASVLRAITWQADPDIMLCWDAGTYSQSHGCRFIDTAAVPGMENVPPWSGGLLDTPSSTPIGAVEYCRHLEPDGATISNGETGYWRLPTYEELKAELAARPETFLQSGPGAQYWSGTPYVAQGYDHFVRAAGNDTGPASDYNNVIVAHQVRCVHDEASSTSQ